MSSSTVPFEELSFTVDEACGILKCGRTFLFGLISSNAIGSYKDGRLRKITGRAINEYRAKRTRETMEASSAMP